MQELVRGRELIAAVEANLETATLEVGRRLRLDDVIVVEWTINYGDETGISVANAVVSTSRLTRTHTQLCEGHDCRRAVIIQRAGGC